jgi:hypothetical protein
MATAATVQPAAPQRGLLKRTILLLASMAVAVAMALLVGCQSEKQGGSQGGSSSKTTAHAQTAEQTVEAQGGDLGQARSELGPKVEKIMGSPFYRYAEWGYLEVDPSDGSTVRSLGPPTASTSPALRPSSSASRRPSTTSASTTASRRRSTPRGRSRTASSVATWSSLPAAT